MTLAGRNDLFTPFCFVIAHEKPISKGNLALFGLVLIGSTLVDERGTCRQFGVTMMDATDHPRHAWKSTERRVEQLELV
jgi:hypothetical protein